jgi:hypothetical protein
MPGGVAGEQLTLPPMPILFEPSFGNQSCGDMALYRVAA